MLVIMLMNFSKQKGKDQELTFEARRRLYTSVNTHVPRNYNRTSLGDANFAGFLRLRLTFH